MKKFYKNKLKEIESMKQDALKQIDENPFILHSQPFLWRLSAWILGIKEPLSQAEYMKREIDFQFEAQKLMLFKHMQILERE